MHVGTRTNPVAVIAEMPVMLKGGYGSLPNILKERVEAPVAGSALLGHSPGEDGAHVLFISAFGDMFCQSVGSVSDPADEDEEETSREGWTCRKEEESEPHRHRYRHQTVLGSC